MLDDCGYRSFLETEGRTDKAIDSRITRANRVEREFNINLDTVIQSEEEMLNLREKIYKVYGGAGSTPGNLYNSVTKYFNYKNRREMPRINKR